MEQWNRRVNCSVNCSVLCSKSQNKENNEGIAKRAKLATGKKGHTAWNKGLTKEMDSRVAKYAESVSRTQLGRTINKNQLRGLEKGRLWCKGLDKSHPSIARRAAILSKKYSGKPNPEHSKRMKEFYKLNPDKHPNAIVGRKTKGHGFTYIENIIAELLNKIGLKFEFNHRIGSKWVDFALLNYSKIIECDGEFWHQDQEKERKRDAYLLENGWEVLHLTGNEIVTQIKKCKEVILGFVGEIDGR